MKVSQVMHKGISSAQIDDSIRRVASRMKKEDIGAMPVYKNERPVGFVTDRDIVISCLATGHTPDDPISLAMSRDIVFIHQDQDISDAIHLMEQRQISRLLVVDKSERPVGMLSLRDITMSSADENLKSEILSQIKRS